MYLGIPLMFGKKNKEEKEEEISDTLPEYDFERDGSLVSPKLRKTDEVLEAYWIEPGLTRVTIIRTAEYENIYIAHEPALTPFEAELLERLQPAVRDLLIMKDIELNDRKEVLYESIDYLLDSYDLPITNATVYKMRYYLKRTFFGWGRVDILRGDHDIEDISCSGYDLPVYLYHRKYRDIKTTIFFTDPRELDSQVVLFAQKSGKHISLSNPIVDATLSDGSRIQLTYSTVISTRGSSFTIRKFRKNPFSPIDLLVNNTFTIDEMVYLWMAVQYNYSVLIVGGTASGKTTTLNAISQFIPALSKVVSIEDTREIMLEHDNWIASLVPLSSGASSVQRDITMFDLLKAAMRQRPEYILVGEVRGIEAQTLFQAMNSGHTTFSTLHGGDVTMAIHRLENPPLDVPKATIETLDIVLCQGSMFRNKKQVRRCKEITEIVGMTDKGELEVNTVYLYNYQKDAPSFSGTSQVYSSIAEKTGKNMSMMAEDIRMRTAVLQAMLDQDIRDYRDFARIVWLFLSRPKYVMANVGDLTQILPGKCKIHETLANRPIGKDEYPEMVEGPAESDAAYGTGSSISDRTAGPKVTRVCYIPDSQGVYFTVDSAPIPDSAEPGVCYVPEKQGGSTTPDIEASAPASGPIPVSGEQTSIVDSVPILDSAEPGVSLLPDDVPESSVPEEFVSPEVIPESSAPEESVSPDVVPESSAPEESVSPDVVPEPSTPEESVSPDVVPESSAPEESVSPDVVPESSAPEVGAAPDDVEDFFFDIHAPIRSNEEIFGPSEPEPESIFEVAPEKEISSFDLYADEQTSGSPPEKKQQ